MTEKILILDFGSQYTQLIARAVREANVYCEIIPFHKSFTFEPGLKGIILSGSPFSVNEENAPVVDIASFIQKVPVLGVCYGAQLTAKTFGGTVNKSNKREYGRAHLQIQEQDTLLAGVDNGSQVWMSHSDSIVALPEGFQITATTESIPIAAFKKTTTDTHPLFGLQFHPEVYHSTQGKLIIKNFLVNTCGCSQNWTPASFVTETVATLKEQIGDRQVIMALSGGVDSTVAATLISKAIDTRLHGIFVDNGVLRKGEFEQVLEMYKELGLNVTGIDAKDRFPDTMHLSLVEPLRYLFKDDVRKVGLELGIPSSMINRHPFPGPGLAIRILGEVNAEKVALLQAADAIYINALKSHNLYTEVWQAGTILLPVKSVGVMGDERTYEFTVALRAVTSVDGMTADWAHLPYSFLAHVSNEIINQVRGINRVVYDISSKPPATIEWE